MRTLLVALLLQLLSPPAWGQCDGARPSVQLEVESQDRLQEEEVRSHLLLGIERLGYDVCPEARTRLTVVLPDTEQALLELVTDDARSFQRALNLQDLPGESRALTIAIAAGEWLRSIQRGEAPEVQEANTVAVAVAEESGVTPVQPDTTVVSGGLGGEWHTGGQLLYGLDVGVSHWFWERLAVGGMLGVRSSPRTSTPLGAFSTRGWVGGISISVALVPRTPPAWVEAHAGLTALRLAYAGPFEEGPPSETAVVSHAGASLWVVAGSHLRFMVGARLGYPLRQVRVLLTDSSTAASLSGLQVALRTGIAFAL